MLGARAQLNQGMYNWIYFFLLFQPHSLSLERTLHLFSLVQQSENSYVSYSWMDELKQCKIAYFNRLLWKSLATSIRLTFGFLPLEGTRGTRFSPPRWCDGLCVQGCRVSSSVVSTNCTQLQVHSHPAPLTAVFSWLISICRKATQVGFHMI